MRIYSIIFKELTSWDPFEVTGVLPSYAGNSPKKQRKFITLQEEIVLLEMYHRLRSVAVVAHHFKINELGVRTIIKKRKGNS